MTAFDERAQHFTDELTELIRQTVDPEARFERIEGRIGLAPFSASGSQKGFARLPLLRKCDSETPALFLKADYHVAPDETDEFIQVMSSTFGIWVRPDPQKPARPVVRVEYDREQRGTKPPAHVHLHAVSVELGWLYGTAGTRLPPMEEIHFPVGGRRFRPTLEELLLFMEREGLFDNWVPGWKTAIERSFDEWERRQASATARAFPVEAAEALRRLGYQVAPPPDDRESG